MPITAAFSENSFTDVFYGLLSTAFYYILLGFAFTAILAAILFVDRNLRPIYLI
jgi:tetrahydromethanopterin S-methyltransferase subunit B